MRAIRRFTVRPVLPPELAPLGELAFNLRWCWHAPTRDLFAAAEPEIWAATGEDPVRLLGEVPADRWEELAGDAGFQNRLAAVAADLREYLTADRWYQGLGPDVPGQVAYFSPEFGLSATLPQYSGGLGILAGDHLKAASDLGVPLVGVGLLYRHGYFTQSLSPEAWQQERYPLADPDSMPLRVLREPDGRPARVAVDLPGGRRLAAQVWVAQVGRIPLLLLDSGVEENEPPERDVTDRLYGGSSEHRLLQEMLLGIGGVRALRAYSRITGARAPEIFHTNEGHAGFLGLERIREYVEERGLEFEAALEVTRAGTVFTTHTPVPAGIDRFGRDQIEHYFGAFLPDGVGRILDLGAETYDGGDPGVFNMAVMGLRLAQRANGVSQLHGAVSRQMFAGLWPGFDVAEVPITSVTNGVHAPTWVAREMAELDEGAPESELWKVRAILRAQLVEVARTRLRASTVNRGASEAELGWVDGVLDPEVLTIGFARRVPSYKRLTLMLRDRERLVRLLTHPQRPIQLVIAGKAHPADDGGKRLIQEIVQFSDDPRVRERLVFLPDYDMGLSYPLVAGCDVWLNNPLRPYEACGTSGMKAALNGGLNLSIRDGWWDEWSDEQNGWSIPSAEGVEDPDRRDDLEAAALYDLLEEQVAPRFYDRDGDGLPRRWLEMVRHTRGSLGPRVRASRMLEDYIRELYGPAARSSRALNASFDGARTLAAWKHRVRERWAGVGVDHVESTVAGRRSGDPVGDPVGPAGDGGAELGAVARLRVFVSLGELGPDDVDVQALHGRVDDSDRIASPTVVSLRVAETYEHGRHRYEGEVALDRTGPFGYTVRVLPRHPGLAAGSELGLVAWPADPRHD